MSDAELGRSLGVSRQAIEAVVNGRKDITVRRLHEVANVLGVRVRDLFDE
ncbi:MAG: helix-turn-helix transcriptional regulator [Paludibacteraceae bacterium]|nr:helix-turn-helix transcriptional regulator [Paludibacteraceae bacterium]